MWLEPRESLSFGRTDTADVAIGEDVSLSRVHFRITNDGEKCVLLDEKSTNGTFVNGKRVSECRVGDGDVILAGTTRFKLQVSDKKFETVSLPMAPELSSTKKRTDVTMRLDSPFAPAASAPVVPVAVPAAIAAAVGSVSTSSPSDGSARVGILALSGAPADTAPHVVTRNRTIWPVTSFSWENPRGECRLTVVIKASFRIGQDGRVQPLESPLPVWKSDQEYESGATRLTKFEADTSPVKPKADVVLVGSAYAPQAMPVKQLDVRLRVGKLERTIRVFGDRRWQANAGKQASFAMTEPKPFAQMPLTYDRAFGGTDPVSSKSCPENPVGTGFLGNVSSSGADGVRLPNLENPDQLIVDVGSRPMPVGFGFFGRSWLPRLKYAGTYDEAYRRERAPQIPLDYTYDFCNAAHPDLQVTGFLRGDEDVELVHVTPNGHCQFQLPNLKLKVAIVQRLRDGQPGASVATRPRLDTLVLVPDQEYFYLLYRAVFPTASLDNPDIQFVDVANL